MVTERQQEVGKRAFPCTSTERFPSGSTVGGDLGERRGAQRFPVFADTEEVTGSNPVAPTTPRVSRASADRFVPPMGEDRQREVADGRESVYLFNQGVHLRPQPSAGRLLQPDVALDLRSLAI